MSENNAGIFYGRGVFTTIAVKNGRIIFWDKHRKRLMNNAASIELDISEHSFLDILERIDDRLQTEKILNGKIRLTFYDRSGGDLWPNGNSGTEVVISVGAQKPIPDRVVVGLSEFSINSQSPLAGIKSCNYLENLIALDRAKKGGYTEAIRLDQNGFVASCVMANIFWIKDDEIYTPSLESGCLPGTTREFVLENILCREVLADLDDLKSADAAFITSAGSGILQVDELIKKTLLPLPHQFQEIQRSLLTA